MNLEEHFKGYKESFWADAFAGYPEYMQKTETNDSRWPFVYDYVKMVTKEVTEAIKRNDFIGYRKWLCHHQEANIATMEKMASEKDLNTILNLGWSWYKFSKYTVEFDILKWVPRHKSHTEEYTFCADEMAIVFDMSRTDAQTILGKKKSRDCVLTRDGLLSLSELNKTVIRDWAGRLFYEN